MYLPDNDDYIQFAVQAEQALGKPTVEILRAMYKKSSTALRQAM